MKSERAQWEMKTRIGPIYLIASPRGLECVCFEKQNVPMLKTLEQNSTSKVLSEATKQLAEYFEGKRKSFDLPLNTKGTPFQKRVWRELSRIPYGTTRSYRDVARRIKHDRAYRAVGTANGKNPVAIIVPCHRVIAADGTLGGYASGLKTKSKLLALEKAS